MHMLDKTCTAYFFDFWADWYIFVICSNSVEQSRFWCRAVFSSRWILSSWPFSIDNIHFRNKQKKINKNCLKGCENCKNLDRSYLNNTWNSANGKIHAGNMKWEHNFFIKYNCGKKNPKFFLYCIKQKTKKYFASHSSKIKGDLSRPITERLWVQIPLSV